MLKVGLTGAHGVGKTTLSQDLYARLQGSGLEACFTPEVPREIIREAGDDHFFRRGQNTVARQFLIIARQIWAESESGVGPVLLCDRTLLDHWCYTISLFPDFGDSATLRRWEGFVMSYQRTYDVLFYLPIEFQVVDDGVRESDLQFQAEIDRLIREHLDRAGLNYSVVRGPRAQRTDSCESLIRSRLNLASK